MQPTLQPLAPPAPNPSDIARIRTVNKRKLTWGIVCLVAPTALVILSIIFYAIINFLFLDGDSIVRTLSNVALFLVGAIAVLTWLPGIIVGIILIATRQRV